MIIIGAIFLFFAFIMIFCGLAIIGYGGAGSILIVIAFGWLVWWGANKDWGRYEPGRIARNMATPKATPVARKPGKPDRANPATYRPAPPAPQRTSLDDPWAGIDPNAGPDDA